MVDGCWYWARVVVGIGGLLGVRVFGWKGVGNLGIGKVDLLWTPGRRPADLLNFVCKICPFGIFSLDFRIANSLAKCFGCVASYLPFPLEPLTSKGRFGLDARRSICVSCFSKLDGCKQRWFHDSSLEWAAGGQY